MPDRNDKAAEFRRQAALCLKVAERMSLNEDRDRMIEMVQHFLKLAQEEDTKGVK
jgi:hypothetical protein